MTNSTLCTHTKRPVLYLKTLNMTTLAGLAPELLLSISDFLPLVDLYCFSVCNHRLYGLRLLSRQMNPWPPLTPDDKFSILTRLERDIPPYFACKSCNLLYRYDGSERFGLSGFYPERTCQLPCVQHSLRPKHWFSTWDTLAIHQLEYLCIQKMSFLHLKLAMRRFYYGPESGISTGSLSYTQVTEYPGWPTKNGVTWLFSREAQICTKPIGLYLRVQDILLFSEWRDLIDKPYATHFDPLVLCPHDTTFRQWITHILRSHDTREKGFLDKSRIFVVCNVRNIVCDIELCEIDSQKVLVITRWLNLGPGLDEEDPLWKIHTYSPCVPRLHCGFDPDYSAEAQCPRCRFEETAPRSFKDLRLRNLSYLRDKQYRRIMGHAYGWNTWHGPFREPSTNRIINFGRSLQAFFGIFPGPVLDKNTQPKI